MNNKTGVRAFKYISKARVIEWVRQRCTIYVCTYSALITEAVKRFENTNLPLDAAINIERDCQYLSNYFKQDKLSREIYIGVVNLGSLCTV